MTLVRDPGPGASTVEDLHSTTALDDALEAGRGSFPGSLLALSLAVLFALALGIRLIGMGGAVTEDEDQWIARAGNFAAAISKGDWGRTYQTGHPGVLPMWLITFSLGPEQAATFSSAARGNAQVTELPTFLSALRTARLPFAVLGALLTVVNGYLLTRLIGWGPGLVGAALLATDPYWGAMGPIVGMDGLLSGFLLASILSLFLATQSTRRVLPWVAASGLFWTLAALTKTSAAFGVPALAIIGLVMVWNRGWSVRTAGTVAGTWMVVGLLFYGALWPAMWTNPFGIIWRTIDFSARLGGAPHAPGNFLLGVVTDDPGPLFYPVALGLRLGPATTLGLLGLLGLGMPARLRRITWILLIGAVLFIALFEISPKKVDRYILPVLPIADVLAGIGWWSTANWLARNRVIPSRQRASLFVLAPLLVIVALVQAWPLASAGRYPLSAYNPLLGGARAAELAIPVGWGEGLDDAAAIIDEMSGHQSVTTAIWYPLWVNYQAHAHGRVVTDARIAEADYFIDYVHARQRNHTPRQLQSRPPNAVVRINGVDYARIFKLR